MEADPPLSEVGASEVVAHVLGPVRFDGDSNRFSRRIAEEVVIYLALHRAGVTEERLMTALWPDRAPARSSFNQAVSRARVGLGVSADGAHRLPLVTDALYRVTDVVMTDVEQLDHLRRKLASAQIDADEERAVEVLGSIDGLPFTSRGPGYEWAHAEGQVAWAQGVVSDAGHFVACFAIERGEPATSIDAARAALRACPADEVLYRDLMRAFDAMGNPAAVEAAFRELCAVIEAEVPEDDVHPETWDLFRQLVPRAVRSVS
jgi:DNA-binding SARP family transcriptional activator